MKHTNLPTDAKPVNTEYYTKEYKWFKFIDWNRAVKPGFVKDLIPSTRRFGILQPVLVDREGRILDGQHRVRAAEAAGLPVPFLFRDVPYEHQDEYEALVSALNVTQHKWKPLQYLECFIKQGNSHYVEFSKVKKDLGLSLTATLAFLHGQMWWPADQVRFNDGDFQMSSDLRKRYLIFGPPLKKILAAPESTKTQRRLKNARNIAPLCVLLKQPRFDVLWFCRKLRNVDPGMIPTNLPFDEATLKLKQIYNQNRQVNKLSVEL